MKYQRLTILVFSLIMAFNAHLYSQSAKVLKDKSLLVDYIKTRQVTEVDEPVQFGAVYFRRSNPTSEDWERDYKQAASDGHNVFRHWFTWNAINTAPGEYNWEPYDAQLDLAAKYGIKTVIAEFVANAPDWVHHKYPDARKETIEGRKHTSEVNGSCLTGGGGMCEDSPDVKKLAEEYLVAMVEHYKGHPGLYGYDIYNEYSFYRPANVCYCPHTQAKFREWLKNKYGSLEKLGDAWFRWSYTDWEEVKAPRSIGPYPPVFDWMQFNSDNNREKLQWRADIIHKHDPDAIVTAHGNANTHKDAASSAGDDWVGGKVVEIYGYTYGRGQRYNLLLSGDMTRMASYGKEYWRAEAAGNTGWVGRQEDREPYNHMDFDPGKFYMGLELEDQHNYPENLRIECYITLASGARGFLSPRWRPLMDGQYIGGYGWYDDDGTPTDRSEMIASIAKWANQPVNNDLWDAKPIRGEVGLLMLIESQALNYGRYRNTDYFQHSYEGAFEAFYDANIQCDPIQLDQIDDYDFVYVPYPVAMKNSTVETLLKWVEAGGTLVLEGCPGFVTDHAKELQVQPNRGLEKALGCTQLKAHLGPDRWSKLKVHSDQGIINGSLIRQSYKPTTGTVLGRFTDGTAAVIGNAYGKGKALVIGTMPGFAYLRNKDGESRKWFVNLMEFAGKEPHLSVPYNTGVIARVNASEKGVFLWVLNVSSCDQRIKVYLNDDEFAVKGAISMLGEDPGVIDKNGIEVFVRERDAAIIRLF